MPAPGGEPEPPRKGQPGRLAGVVVLLGVWVALVATITTWFPVDARIFDFVQAHRNCDVIWSVAWIDSIVPLLLGSIGLTAAVPVARRDVRLLLAVGAVVASGAIGSEILKTVFERPRPGSPLTGLEGNSFPSGHVMNTTLLAIGVGHLALAAGWGRIRVGAVGLAGVLCVAAQALFRVVNGSHWASDLPGSVLAAVIWMMAAPLIGRLGRRFVAAGVLGALGVYGVFLAREDWRLRIPSVLEPGPPVVARADPAHPGGTFGPGWVHGFREPKGAVSWLARETGTLRLDASSPAEGIRLVVRPPTEHEAERGCVSLVVGAGGWTSEPLFLHSGWRALVVKPPPGLLRAGPVGISLRVDLDIHREGVVPGRLALADLRLTASEP